MSDSGWIEDAGLPIVDNGEPLPAAGCSGDIMIRWDNLNMAGDWVLAAGDLQTGQDLETACLVSLFTDKLATPDFVPTDGTSDRRGWWADPYNDSPLGSNLWQLERAKKTRDTLALARRYAQDALQWLITDGVATQVNVNTSWLGRSPGSTALGMTVAIVKPNGSLTRFTFGWAWQNLAALAIGPSLPRPPRAPKTTLWDNSATVWNGGPRATVWDVRY
jgi:phage gp46-like protein